MFQAPVYQVEFFNNLYLKLLYTIGKVFSAVKANEIGLCPSNTTWERLLPLNPPLAIFLKVDKLLK